MIRQFETTDRFGVRARLSRDSTRDIGVRSNGPRTAQPRRHTLSRAKARPNLILDWLRARRDSFDDYLAHLARLDRALPARGRLASCGTTEPPRLALALFIDFAHAHGLSPVEMAALLTDAPRQARDALERCQASAADPRHAGDPWGDACGISIAHDGLDGIAC